MTGQRYRSWKQRQEGATCKLTVQQGMVLTRDGRNDCQPLDTPTDEEVAAVTPSSTVEEANFLTTFVFLPLLTSCNAHLFRSVFLHQARRRRPAVLQRTPHTTSPHESLAQFAQRLRDEHSTLLLAVASGPLLGLDWDRTGQSNPKTRRATVPLGQHVFPSIYLSEGKSIKARRSAVWHGLHHSSSNHYSRPSDHPTIGPCSPAHRLLPICFPSLTSAS